MTHATTDVIPAERQDVVRAALASAFGALPVRLSAMPGGASGALLYRVDTAEGPYLLRLETRRGPLRNPHQYACMRIAADAHIAPAVRHVDDETGVAIMNFVPSVPLAEYPGGAVALAGALGALTARLQATPSFPALREYPMLLGRMLGYIRGSGMFAEGLLDRHAEAFERIRDAYPWNPSAAVSSHNDPNPFNVIFDGARLWLIDWETAYRSEPLVDVAILLENFGTTPESEQALLEAWRGTAPDESLRLRLLLMRPLTRLYYACLLFSVSAAAPRTAPDGDLTAPAPDEFRSAVRTGRLRPGAPETTYTLGKMLLAGFLAGLDAPGFERALAMARQI